jgi:4-hydroxybenzoate polyprenyltransferase
MGDPTKQPFPARAMLAAMRPSQWTKNAVVLAAGIFALWDQTQALGWRAGLRVIPAAFVFCLVSSAIYILNDIRDLEADRTHPLKRHRPIAAGRLTVAAAWTLSLVLLAVALAGATWLSKEFLGVIVTYIVLQIAYSWGLKRVALVDVFMIASGFVLRALAGAVVLDVLISPWLLICTFLLALFLGLCKRRDELVKLADAATGHRQILDEYSPYLLDQMIAVVTASTLMAYALYTMADETIQKFNTAQLHLTIPFVIYGIFRYLYLIHRKEQGGNPSLTLLTDRPLLINILLWTTTVILIIYWSRLAHIF